MSEEDINFLISIQGLEQPEFDNACLERENKKLENEIERLTKQNKALNEMYELTKKEYIRLNNIIKQQDTRNSRQRIANRKLLERNQDLVIENLKSNNIINELEKWCLSWKENDKYCYLASNDKDKCRYDIWEEVLDKLQELRGVDKK